MTPERLALAGLSAVTEPGDAAVRRAVLERGPVEVWQALRRGVPLPVAGQDELPGLELVGTSVLPGAGGLPAAAARRAADVDPSACLAVAAACGARLVLPTDAEWPADRLDWSTSELDPPPLWLWVRGREPLAEAVERSVAVVGARAASAYGVHVATELGHGLAERGASVVSGGAYGIDAAAHRGALAAGGAPTVAVLACGVDVGYPRGNDRLLEQVARSGLVVSELPPGAHPTRKRFLVRNRLIAALSLGTVVVEAALRSGSLATLNRAQALGRHVMAVPGPVTSGMSAGCHERLRQGAACVTCAADVLDVVGRLGSDAAPEKRGPVDVRDGLSETVLSVLEALPVRRGMGIGRIAQAAGVTPRVVQQVLPPLMAHGLVLQTPDGWRLSPLGAGKSA